ncbi:hypothetical protein O181_102380 [Austropuccinia psidii MF-1]|uniref:Uncharacterized protein n=1 Tax=Austropuccinia psidii MF-1 TaxID=1389203 RepID=A0A9Q3JG61_9BASI|nr:hypothetical protein [Austropuccinia psidii MF-1]
MTHNRSGRNYFIQSHGSGPGNSSQKSKRHKCKPRGEAQMEDARASTSSKILARTFDTLIESPEADITAIPVSLDRHNEILSSSEEAHGPRKDRRTSEWLDTHVLQETGPTDKSLVEKPKHFVRGPEEEAGPRKGQQPSGSSPSLHKQNSTSKSAKQGQANPKEQSEGQAKGKGKGKVQVEQALPTELQNSQEREDSHGQCVQYCKNSNGIQKQGGGKIEPIISKEVELVKLVTHFETCNKQILAKLNNFEYIQQKLGREISQVTESQKT